MSDFLARLEIFLNTRNEAGPVEQLTPDASTREYFRIGWRGSTAIACVYPNAFVEAEQSYLDVTSLFLKAGLPVAEIYDFDEELGVIVQEDLGDRILRDALLEADEERCERLLDEAISLIPRIQAATATAFEIGSIASRLKFDTEKLVWELESKATVLCHRDFHAANLMLDAKDRLRIIDHQDARIGSVAYDLVSLLLDRVTEPPSAERLSEKRDLFLAGREALGLAPIDRQEFTNEFRLQTVQRCLKAVGTFSFQSVNRGKTYFVPFIKPMFQIVLRALGHLDRFPVMRAVLEREIS